MSQFTNVNESWSVYDTLCVSSAQYGSESSSGWFTTFLAFAAQETHSFFKQRTEGSVGLAYSNRQVADTMDFAFTAYSFGIAFFSPGVRPQGRLASGAGTAVQEFDNIVAHWWETELPRHCAIQLKVQQDIVAELPCYAAPPGYGPVGGGAAFNHENPINTPAEGALNPRATPAMNFSMTQGAPNIGNRWKFTNHVRIPRTATIEAVLVVSEPARNIINRFAGPWNYLFQPAPTDAGNTEFPSRYGIQVSLLGKRAVQQRAQYHV